MMGHVKPVTRNSGMQNHMLARVVAADALTPHASRHHHQQNWLNICFHESRSWNVYVFGKKIDVAV